MLHSTRPQAQTISELVYLKSYQRLFLFGYGHRMYEYVHSFSAVSVRTGIFPTVCTYYRRKNCTYECTDGFYSSTVRTYGAKTDCTYIYLLIDQLKLRLVL